MAKARTSVADPSKMVAFIGLGFTFIMNAATAGYVYGGVSYRQAAIEERVTKLEKRVDDFNNVSEGVAIVKTQLQSISATLARLERVLEQTPPARK